MVALIMILSAVGVGSFISSTTKSKDTQRKNDLNQLAKAVETFNNDLGKYPSSITGSFLCYEKTSDVGGDVSCVGDKLTFRLDGKVTTYINIPKDPDSTQKYYYESDGASFSLYTAIQNLGDKDILRDENGTMITYTSNGVSCGSSDCNYKLTETGLVK